MRSFNNRHFQLEIGDTVYLLTDGFADQFGGMKGKKFGTKRLRRILLENNHLSMYEKGVLLQEIFNEWKGNADQVDDVCILGIDIIDAEEIS